MAPDTTPDWAAVRRRYEETSDPVAQICADAGITEGELVRTRGREKWRRKFPRPFPRRRVAAVELRTPDGSVERSLVVATPDTCFTPAPQPAGSEPAPPRPRRRPDRPPPRSGRAAAPPDDEPAPAAPRRKATAAARKRSPRRANDPAARRRLLARLAAAISLKLEQLERRMSNDLADLATGKGDPAAAADHERETRAIGALIDNLGKVTEMETGLDRAAIGTAAAASTTSDLTGEADRWRRELAGRLQRIVEAHAGKPQ